MALQSLFANIPQANLIHDDLNAATTIHAEHNKAFEAIINTISRAGITLNPDKCTFGALENDFWALRIGSDGVRPNSDFNFAPFLAAQLRALTKRNVGFVWTKAHQTAYEVLISSFKQNG